jgi:hypothetical protein
MADLKIMPYGKFSRQWPPVQFFTGQRLAWSVVRSRLIKVAYRSLRCLFSAEYVNVADAGVMSARSVIGDAVSALKF